MLFEKIVCIYFPDMDDYSESPVAKHVSFKLEGDYVDVDLLNKIGNILEPEVITYQVRTLESNSGGCGDPECCGSNYLVSETFVICSGVRFSEEDEGHENVEVKKLPDLDNTY